MRKPQGELRRGWTTGACATAAVKAALDKLWGGTFERAVTITLPRGETPTFPLAHTDFGVDWAEVGITKDAGDDPDVTHGALVIARVEVANGGIVFAAGEGVGHVTKPGLPLAVGEPAINPVPRKMMLNVVEECSVRYRKQKDIRITISIPGGLEIAQKTWNPRLGIKGGLSILGTTGVVRPFSCAAWIASIHRGIDVARAAGLSHVAGCTGATSEGVVQSLYDLPEHAMLDMGDFAGGMIKYLAKNPLGRLTIGGGIGKLTKLAQGAVDLHSSRSQVDFDELDQMFPGVSSCNTALEASQIAGPEMAAWVARTARDRVMDRLRHTDVDIIVIDRAGTILGQAG